MKKLIFTLTSVMGITLTASAVVSCGISFNSLLQRKVDTDHFKGYFQFNPNSLVSAKTMQAQDFELISDLNVPLVTVDPFGRTIGELAVKFDPAIDKEGGSQFVGNRIEGTDGKAETWTYLINKNAKWTNSQNQVFDNIKGTDFLNIFLYIAHPNTASETKSFWGSYIYGAAEIIDYIDNGNGTEADKGEGKSIERYTKVHKAITNKVGNEDGSFDGTSGFSIVTSTEQLKTFYLGLTAGRVKELVGTDNDPDNAHPGKGSLYDNDSFYVKWTGLDNVPMPFFDSLMTYASFAPLPYQAVNISDDAKAGSFANYMTTENFVSTALYSGPFVLKKLQLSQSVEYEKNKYYVNQKDIHFNKMTKTFKSKATDGELRTSFESGDLTELKLRPTDPQGWNTYVGTDPENPKFKGVTVEGSKAQATYGIYMNAINTNLWNPNPSPEGELNSRILTSSIMRQYLMTTIQKSWMSKYYSSAFDKKGERHISATTVNTFTPTNFAFAGETDYVEYLAAAIGSNEDRQININTPEAKELFELLKPGGDFYSYHKNVVENEAGGEVPEGYKIIRGITDENEFEVENEKYLDSVRKEFNELAGSKSVRLNHLTNGARSNTENIYTQNMIDIFNRTAKEDGIDITIVQDQTNDESEFKSKRSNAAFDLLVLGWSPDFSDPVSYLNTHKLNGDLANYYGLHRIIDARQTSNILNKWKEKREELKYSDLQGMLNTSYVAKDDKTKDQFTSFIKDIAQYTELVENASEESNLDDRFKGFATAEKLMLIDKSFMIPIYDPFVLPSVKMSFVLPFSYSTVGYGSSQYLHRGWKILPSMPTLYDNGAITRSKKAYLSYDRSKYSGLKLATLDKDFKYVE
ncbi:oligopeptide transport system substrate-binding protein [Spiroplasma sp. TIUS-1]|uniref:hypothetical protein n=1 Tax=Spiroplasma sp. TIUS-1 TaxID=216963 RepID=UPI001398EE5E|nr:hypothetical protein [Spiroplasma sp. TIUS-1]QHX36086.1 oligopeptide transport system substrate-binding protein [Spiroplasma sp. TIUS-1]